MSEVINLDDEFNSWFNAVEVFSLRSERFYEELPSMTSHQMLAWLKAAYLHGVKTAAEDSVKTLAEYSASLEGCNDVQYYPSQSFDVAADNLSAYWDDILKDSK